MNPPQVYMCSPSWTLLPPPSPYHPSGSSQCTSCCLGLSWASLLGQMVKNLPTMWETWVWSLGWEDPLEEVMATHPCILPGEPPWTEEPRGLKSMGSQRIRYDWVTELNWTVCLVAQSYLTFCDPLDYSPPGFPVHHQLLELAQTHVHRVGDAFQQSLLLSSPSPPAFNLSQHQGLFQWVCHSFPSQEQVSFNLMAVVTVHSDFRAQENKICHSFHFFLIYLSWSDGAIYHDLSFLNAEF